MNDFLNYNKIRGEILKTILDNYLESPTDLTDKKISRAY